VRRYGIGVTVQGLPTNSHLNGGIRAENVGFGFRGWFRLRIHRLRQEEGFRRVEALRRPEGGEDCQQQGNQKEGRVQHRVCYGCTGDLPEQMRTNEISPFGDNPPRRSD
jgi:hypothetical protein